MSAGVNDLSGRVGKLDRRTAPPTVAITGIAAAAIAHMLRSCPDGLADDWTTADELAAALPDASGEALADGLAHLEALGLVESRHLINAPPRYRLAERAYEALDAQVTGWDTVEDAKALAREVLATSGTVSVPALAGAMGWPRRRLNPALRLVVSFVGEARVSRAAQPEYVTWHFSPNTAERAALGAFAV